MNNTPSQKRFLILGSAGMAGHMVYTYLKERGQNVYGVDVRPNGFSVDKIANITNFDVLGTIVTKGGFDFVVNCAALLGKPMLENPELARRINVEMPHMIAETLQKTPGHLFHISSDFVFSGDSHGGNYGENSAKDNETPYGKYKREGEPVMPHVTNLRLSIIGPTPQRIVPNFLNNIIESTSDSLWGLTNAYWSGITTLELAKTILELSDKNGLEPVYHLCSAQKETRFETIKSIMDVFEIKLPLEARLGEPKDYSLVSTLLPCRKPLKEQLIELRQWMILHPNLYGVYVCLKK